MDLLALNKLFPTETSCIEYLEDARWKGGHARCPYCSSIHTSALRGECRHHCNSCRTSFSVTVGTLFQRTHVPLQRWFFAVYLIFSAKKNISARKLAGELNVNKNTAWYLATRIRKAMAEVGHRDLLQGIADSISLLEAAPQQPIRTSEEAKGE